ncbi:unnamed protein product [Moneuplotes crassus]|uniref:Uncharacterized protein n=1 Tax=Euplotes crassus TaxID=5936 RepID=A0AAD1XF01_EUPCR|nr:unnamed protein product [Moneuplotes crassus]
MDSKLDFKPKAKDKRKAFAKKTCKTQSFPGDPQPHTRTLNQNPSDSKELYEEETKEEVANSEGEGSDAAEETPPADSPHSPLGMPTAHDLLYKKLKTYDSHVQYFLSYQIENFEGFMQQCIEDPTHILDCLAPSSPPSTSRTPKASPQPHTDLKMELTDRVPQIDRPNFPITNLIQTIPRLLFKPEDLGIQRAQGKEGKNRVQMSASTAVYLNSCAQYAYITGALVYEDLALIHQAKGDMEYHKMEKDKEVDKVNDKEKQRVGTESTKDTERLDCKKKLVLEKVNAGRPPVKTEKSLTYL